MLEDGRLGLIDYGQVKYLTPEERIKAARLIVSLANNNEVYFIIFLLLCVWFLIY